VLIAILDGFLYMYLWPESPMMQNAARSYFFAVSFIWGIIFTVHFLKTDQFYPRVSTLGYALVTLWAGALFFSFIGNPRIAGLLLNFLALVTIVYGSFIAVLTFRHHDWASRFCFFTWFGFFLLIAGRIVIFNLDVPVAPAVVKIFHVGYRYHIAILVVIIQMLIAISYRLRLIEKERHSSQLETEALKRKTLELKLSALQARVQPHFLFNTLNTIANSVIVDPPRAERALVELSDFYRLTLRYASRGITRLCEEVDLVTRYLTLEKMKIGDRLDFSFSIDECSRQITLPSMSLQILVENSLKHGIHPKVDGGSIRVSAAVNGERCSIVVDDTGVGFRQQKSDSGTGIANLRSRLDLVYHGDYALRITDKRTSNPGETGVTAVVEIPLRPLMKNIPEAL
jgi:sensor histidine kinase YesM